MTAAHESHCSTSPSDMLIDAGRVFVAMNPAGFNLLEKRDPPWVVAFGLAITVVVAFQAAGYRRVRSRRGEGTGWSGVSSLRPPRARPASSGR
jgi:hypothetical protein